MSAMPITQHYAMDVHPAEPHRVYAGNQDNGTVRTPDGALDTGSGSTAVTAST